MKAPSFSKVTKAITELGNASEGHSRLSPSGTKKWMACPGSIVLESFVPNKSTKYSDDGTACHEVAALCLKAVKVQHRADEWVNRYIVVSREGEIPERKVLFTDELADITQQYVDDIRIKSKGHQLWIETRVDFSDWVGVPDQSGTADAAMLLPIDGDAMRLELDVDDLKGGRTPVSVERNPQLMTYALGFLTKLGAQFVACPIRGGVFELLDGRVIEKIRLSIHQPKLHPGPIEWVCTPKELLAFSFMLRSKAISVINAADQYKSIPDDQWNEIYLNPNPNSEECAFCRAMSTCPSVNRKVEESVGAAFEAIEEGADLTPPTPSTSSKKLAAAMAATDLIEDWIKSVRAEVERRLLIADDVPGFGLELGKKGHRKFTDPEQVETLLRKKFRLKVEDVYDFSLKTPTQLEKLTKIQKIGSGTGAKLPPKLGQKQWGQLIELITQSDPKPSVKRLSVIKAPYAVSAPSADAFSAVPESQDEEQLY